ncbi:TonB-dependent receptor [Zunongwangia sp. SCSIO 43204]|uniref:Iron complex outermembrane recepter protein n=1 Tax=Zunongwangia mangrovi TaxID=1334022 RepID=A0A1I1GKR0_9FLAO|nr:MULTISPECIES: TonB-dependent receptor [Zunongwangia]UAB83650.1 TonB-dependent receptor [Zunongwangia sp. SCSIO 43204]SFC12349.1 iron complex outermembrane recepter protein [Zunongwangia mangrovi]
MKQGLLRISLFLLAVLSFSFAKAQTVSGTVTDGSMPIPGVNILVKGTSNGTTTDFDGNFTLNDVANDAVLVFSFVGFSQQEVPVNGRSTINVTLSEDAAALSEVVVIGYGSTTVKDATGAVATVSAEDFNQGVISSPEELIQGKTAGLQITTTSGEPGGGVNIRIRGTSSVRGGNNPLFVVDGVPLAGNEVSSGGDDVGFGSSSAKNPLNFLNPADIESMSVLKDASATAIYGSRGANGVVIITTKSGRGSKGRLDYGTTLSLASPANEYDLLDRDEYLSAVEELGGDLAVLDQGGNTDFQDEITRTAFSQIHNLSYADSYNTGNYRASLSYADQEGIVENSALERLSGRFNITQRLFNDKLKLNLQSTLSRVNDTRAPISNNAGFQGDLLGSAYQANPTFPADPDFQPLGSIINPLALLKFTSDQSETDRVLLNFSADYEIFEGLDAKLNLGYDTSESNREAAISGGLTGIQSGVPGNGRGNLNQVESINRLMEFTLNYQKMFENSKFEALVGYSFQDFERKGYNVSGFGFQSEDLGAMTSSLSAANNILRNNISGSYQQYGYDPNGFFVTRLFPNIATEDLTSPSGIGPTSVAYDSFNTTDELQSYFARVNYELAGKYLFTATVRADGSTRFGGNNKYGVFPSGAFAWQLAEEDFIPETFSTLKLRLGYGITGNQEIPYNQYTVRERYAGFGIQDNGNINRPGVTQVSFANPDLQWEETSQTNLGLDFGFMQDRLSGSLDFYYKNTTDLLIQVFSAQPSPQPFVYQNLDAHVINKGVEFAIDYNIVDNDDWFWNFGFNIAYNDNMVEDYAGQNRTGEINGQGLTGAFAQLLAGGQPLFSYYLREFGGFDETGQSIYPAGDVQSFIGKSALPTTNVGISTRAEYKNWDLSIFMAGQYGHYIYNNTENAFFTKGALNNGRNVTRNVVDNGEAASNAPDVSTRFLEKGDFLRMQNATLGYNFDLNEGSMFNTLRLYLNGQNLFVITDYSGLDPEVDTNKALNGIPSAGIDYTAYPKPRTFTFGLNVSF